MTETFSQQRHSYVVQAIYQAVNEPEGWSEVLAEIRKMTDATGAFFMGLCFGAEGGVSVIGKCVDRAVLVHPDFIDIVHNMTASLGPGSSLVLDAKHDGLPWEAQLADMISYEAQLLLVVIAKEGYRRFNLGLIFGRDDQVKVRLAEQLLMAMTPHLQIAVGIHRQIWRDREKAVLLDRLFSQSNTPRAIVRDNLRIVDGNEAFQRLTESNGSLLKVSEGFLIVSNIALQQEIERLLKLAAHSGEVANVAWVKDPHYGLSWLLKADLVGLKSLTTTPFVNLYVNGELKFMLSFYRIGDHNGLTPALVGSVLGLTTAEASLACALALGRAPAEIAQARGVAKNTVHNQLTSIMARNGFHRQGQLLTLLSTLAFFAG
jgi:DNA-binding CsgD family transcriptional regulator